jgi:hypothetical protein
MVRAEALVAEPKRHHEDFRSFFASGLSPEWRVQRGESGKHGQFFVIMSNSDEGSTYFLTLTHRKHEGRKRWSASLSADDAEMTTTVLVEPTKVRDESHLDGFLTKVLEQLHRGLGS